MQTGPSDQVELDLERLVGRYGRLIAQAELQTEIAETRARRLEAVVAELTGRLDNLDGLDTGRKVDPSTPPNGGEEIAP